jgi:hypothetical protein
MGELDGPVTSELPGRASLVDFIARPSIEKKPLATKGFFFLRLARPFEATVRRLEKPFLDRSNPSGLSGHICRRCKRLRKVVGTL